MKKTQSSNIARRILLFIAILVLFALTLGLYIFFKPQRNIAWETATETISVTDLTRQFSQDPARANAKYLSSDGNSRVLEISGKVQGISRNLSGATVIVLSEVNAMAQVRCNLSADFDTLRPIQKNMFLRIKGAITAGNSYDSILQLQNDATLIGCSIQGKTSRD